MKRFGDKLRPKPSIVPQRRRRARRRASGGVTASEFEHWQQNQTAQGERWHAETLTDCSIWTEVEREVDLSWWDLIAREREASEAQSLHDAHEASVYLEDIDSTVCIHARPTFDNEG